MVPKSYIYKIIRCLPQNCLGGKRTHTISYTYNFALMMTLQIKRKNSEKWEVHTTQFA